MSMISSAAENPAIEASAMLAMNGNWSSTASVSVLTRDNKRPCGMRLSSDRSAARTLHAVRAPCCQFREKTPRHVCQCKILR